MEPMEKNISKIPEKNRLPREVLLADPVRSADQEVNQDPRFKTPDDALLRLMAMKKQKSSPSQPEEPAASAPPMENHALVIEHIEKKSMAPAEDVSPSAIEIETLRSDLKQMREKHDRERIRWKTYEQHVIQWKDQVMQIIENLKLEAVDGEALRREAENLKKLNKKKDDEIRQLMEELGQLSKKSF
jgi:hypothetical protein